MKYNIVAIQGNVWSAWHSVRAYRKYHPAAQLGGQVRLDIIETKLENALILLGNKFSEI